MLVYVCMGSHSYRWLALLVGSVLLVPSVLTSLFFSVEVWDREQAGCSLLCAGELLVVVKE
jgi:hypothetical protein